MIKICIDPGHGGKDSGAVSHDLEEQSSNLIIASLVYSYLSGRMTPCFMTRFSDVFVTLDGRCKIANEKQASHFVSIHANAAENTRAEGFEIFYGSESSKAFAESVYKKVQSFFPKMKFRGIKPGPFYVLKYTKMPSILIECGFVSNEKDALLLKDENHQILMAQAIAEGILDASSGT